MGSPEQLNGGNAGEMRVFLQYWLFGNIAAGIAYGIAITLSINCLLLLTRSNTTSTRTRRTMISLVLCMCCISTASLVFAVGGVSRWGSEPAFEHFFDELPVIWGQPFSAMELIFIVLPTWLSDGFMIWRCVMLYDGVSPLLRICILACVGLLTSSSFAVGLCSFITHLVGKIWQQYSILSLFELVSLIVNGSISTLIILRILYHQRFLRRVFGPEYGSAYTKVMTMLIESAALTFLLSFLHIVIAAARGKPTILESPVNMVLVKLIAQINTISPILIIFRVAQGRTWQTDLTNTMTERQNDHELEDIQFAINESIPTMASRGLSVHGPPTVDEEAGALGPHCQEFRVK